MIYMRVVVPCAFADKSDTQAGEDVIVSLRTILIAEGLDIDGDPYRIQVYGKPYLTRSWLPITYVTLLSPLEVLALAAK